MAALSGFADPPPGPDTHLFRAEVPDRGMVVFLPETDVASPEDAAAYLEWARKTHPAQASRLRGEWATEEVELPVHWPKEAAFLRKGDSAVDASGSIRFRVEGLAENGRVRIRLESPPAFGEATPLLCLTNAWILPLNELLARWQADLRAHPDTAPAEVKGQIASLAASGRFARRGGEAWRAAVEDFRTNTPALWPRVRFENRTDVPVEIWCQYATNTIAPGSVWSLTVSYPSESDEVKWCARAAADPAFRVEDYEWMTNRFSWSRAASFDTVHFFDTPPGQRKPLPRLRLMLPKANRPMPAGLRAIVRYKEGGEEKTKAIQAHEIDGVPSVEVAPHVPLTGIALEADGYERTGWHSWTDRAEHVLGCGRTLEIPFPNPLSPVKREVAVPRESPPPAPPPPAPSPPPNPAHPATRPSAPPPSQPPVKIHPVAPWLGTVRQTSASPWPWESHRQQIRMRVWWNDWSTINTGQTKDDYDRNAALNRFDNLLQGQDEIGEFRKAYLHVASCKGCASCNAHRDAMMRKEGFEEQRWALFQSLLQNSGADWTDFKEAPDAARIGKLRKLLEERKEKGE